MRPMRAHRAALLALCAAADGQLLCRSAEECGHAHDLCGKLHGAFPLAVRDQATVCVGFQGTEGGSSGQKALFLVEVDKYASLRVDTLRTLMGEEWSDLKAEHSRVWIGTQGRRTIGQQRGVLEVGDGDFNCTGVIGPGATSNVDGGAMAAQQISGPACYGWTVHNKPLVLESGQLAQGLTAIIHLKMGRVQRIVWDSGCNLCPARKDTVQCLPDGTNVSCTSEGLTGGGPVACSDCYAQLNSGCNVHTEVCAPKVYVAWLGTDRHGTPLLSAGSILSRFAAYSLSGVYDDIVNEVIALGDGLTGGGLFTKPPPPPMAPPGAP